MYENVLACCVARWFVVLSGDRSTTSFCIGAKAWCMREIFFFTPPGSTIAMALSEHHIYISCVNGISAYM